MYSTMTYQEVLDMCPDVAETLVQQVKTSRSKKITDDPAEWKWELVWSERIDGPSNFADILSGKVVEHQAAQRAMSVEERVEKRIEQSCVSIQVTCHRTIRRQVITIPEEIIQLIRELEEEEKQEEERIGAMSDEERQAEANEALKQLRGTPGFFEISIPVYEEDDDDHAN